VINLLGVVGGVKKQVDSVRDWVINDILKRQKPELDKKIDEMLKPPKVNQIMLKYLGAGKRIGKSFRGSGIGKTIGKAVKHLGLL
jgi:hypothetical protein